MTDRNPPNSEPQPNRPSPKTFSFRFSLGKKPPLDEPAVRAMFDEASGEAGASPDGIGLASRERKVASLEFSDGTLRVGDKQFPLVEKDDAERAVAGNDELTSLGSPATEQMRTWLATLGTVIAVAIPVVLVIGGIATGQTFETIVYMGVFGLFLAFMVSSLPSW